MYTQLIMFLKKYLLIPFYIFSHEKSFPEYNNDGQKLEKLKAEYQIILERLDELEQQEFIGAFDKRTIIELSGDVIKEIAQTCFPAFVAFWNYYGNPLIHALMYIHVSISVFSWSTVIETLKQPCKVARTVKTA